MATRMTYNCTLMGDTISTTVTHTPSDVDWWISQIEAIHHRSLQSLVVGLDVEWRPSFSQFQNPVATLQLCVGRHCLIFQIIHSPQIPWSLRNFLGNRSYTFVGVEINSDVDKLVNNYNLGVANTADISRLAAEAYGERALMNAGLKELASRVLGKEIDKPRAITLSGWDNRRLTPDQVQYATIDAFISFEMGRVLIYGR